MFVIEYEKMTAAKALGSRFRVPPESEIDKVTPLGPTA